MKNSQNQNEESRQRKALNFLTNLHWDLNKGMPHLIMDHPPFPCTKCGSQSRMFFYKSSIADKDYLKTISDTFDKISDSPDYIVSRCNDCDTNGVMHESGLGGSFNGSFGCLADE